MKKIIFLLLLTTSFGFGQNFHCITPQNLSFSCGTSGLDMGMGFTNNYRGSRATITTIAYDIKGTPYQKEKYAEGFTTILEKRGFEAPMRYNAAKDVVEFLDDDKKVKQLLRRPYITANFDGKTYEVLPYFTREDERFGYFNALNSGQTQLLVMPKKKVKTTGALFQGVREAYYQDVSMFYLKQKGEPAEEIQLNKRSILKKLADRTGEVEEFISDYALNLKRESDVVRLLDFYNSLSSPQPDAKKAQG